MGEIEGVSHADSWLTGGHESDIVATAVRRDVEAMLLVETHAFKVYCGCLVFPPNDE